jgi:hypothetical protein
VVALVAPGSAIAHGVPMMWGMGGARVPMPWGDLSTTAWRRASSWRVKSRASLAVRKMPPGSCGIPLDAQNYPPPTPTPTTRPQHHSRNSADGESRQSCVVVVVGCCLLVVEWTYGAPGGLGAQAELVVVALGDHLAHALHASRVKTRHTTHVATPTRG